MKKLLILSLFLACTLSVLTAQETPADTPDSREITADTQMTYAETQNDYSVSDKPSKNLIKVNLTSLPMKNFSLQYERVLTKSISAAMTFSLMPEKNMSTFIVDKAMWAVEKFVDPDGIDAETEDAFRNFSFSSYTITPEVRFYLGKKGGYGAGFYMALFYKYGHYEISNIPVPFTNDLDEDITIDFQGALVSHTGGFLMGYQWSLGKHMCLDWQMFGPHFGVSSSDFVGVPSTPLSTGDQAKIEDELININSSLIDKTIDATASEVNMGLKGPWAGIRLALSLGVKF
jgi:hypothetical protein